MRKFYFVPLFLYDQHWTSGWWDFFTSFASLGDRARPFLRNFVVWGCCMFWDFIECLLVAYEYWLYFSFYFLQYFCTRNFVYLFHYALFNEIECEIEWSFPHFHSRACLFGCKMRKVKCWWARCQISFLFIELCLFDTVWENVKGCWGPHHHLLFGSSDFQSKRLWNRL